MKKIFSLIALFIFAVGVPHTTLRAQPPTLEINEIGAFESSDAEWILVTNKSAGELNMEGWKFWEDTTNHALNVFRGGIALEAGSSTIIANRADIFAQRYPLYTGAILDSNWGSLKLEGEEIGLRDNNGILVEDFTYPPITSNKSLVRTADGWQPHATSSFLNDIQTVAINTPGLQPTNNEGAAIVPGDEEPSISAFEVVDTVLGTSTPSTTPAEPEPNVVTSSNVAPPPADLLTDLFTATGTPALNIPVPEASPTTISTSSQQTTAQIAHSTPRAVMTIQSGSTTSSGPTTINFDGRNSSDAEEGELTYVWDFGDGTIYNGPNPGPHRYSASGSYLARLTVFNVYGLSDAATQLVQVIERPETPQPRAPESQPQAAPVSIAANTKNETAFVGLFVLKDSAILQNLIASRGVMPISTNMLELPINRDTNVEPQNHLAAFNSKNTPKNTKSAETATIRISELYPMPESKNEDEWIELKNSGGSDVSLEGWMLADITKQKKPYKFKAADSIKAGGFLLIYKKRSKISLNNDADTVGLAAPDGKLVDVISYTGAEKGTSYALVESKTWQWTSATTPGAENPTFQKITGTVTALKLPTPENKTGSVEIKRPDGKNQSLNFGEVDEVAAGALLAEGSSIDLSAEETADGSYEIKNINRIDPPPSDTNKQPESEMTFTTFMLIGGGIFLFAVQGIIFWLLYKKNPTNSLQDLRPNT